MTISLAAGGRVMGAATRRERNRWFRDLNVRKMSLADTYLWGLPWINRLKAGISLSTLEARCPLPFLHSHIQSWATNIGRVTTRS